MSGLLRGWLNDEGWERACRYANACGAGSLTPRRCAPAMPTKVELDDYLLRAESVPRPDIDARLKPFPPRHQPPSAVAGLCIFAFDHRKQLADLAHETGCDPASIPQLEAAAAGCRRSGRQRRQGWNSRSGILADGTYGQSSLNTITGKGWWIGRPIRLPGSRRCVWNTATLVPS